MTLYHWQFGTKERWRASVTAPDSAWRLHDYLAGYLVHSYRPWLGRGLYMAKCKAAGR